MPTPRNRELGLIHQLAKALGMAEDTRRTLYHTVTGKRSAADMDQHERERVIEHLKAKGGSVPPKTRPTIPKERLPLVKKIRALLINHPTGRKPDSYADAIAQHMFGVDRYTWLPPAQLQKIVQALTVDTQRRSA
ncbi:MAG: regulatory protein GemA [Sulfuricellaceae bacterium]